MGIQANNIIVGGEKISPTKLIQQPVEEKVYEEKPTYHEIHDGELHKMINRKSSYLTDMIALED